MSLISFEVAPDVFAGAAPAFDVTCYSAAYMWDERRFPVFLSPVGLMGKKPNKQREE